MAQCDDAQKPKDSFLALLAAPARHALESISIVTVEQLAELTSKEILHLHGVRPSSLPILNQALEARKLTL